MRRLTGFLQQVLDDLGTWCGVSTTHDYEYAVGRIKHEGLAFLAITLAQYGKDFEKSLDRGYVDDMDYEGFRTLRESRIPAFLSGFQRLVFDPVSGQLLHDASVEAIWAIRQLTLMWAKIYVGDKQVTDPTVKISASSLQKREAEAFEKYMECEQDVRKSDRTLAENPELLGRFARVGRLLWARVLTDVDFKVYNGEIRPKHGPGKTADRLAGNRKWEQSEWTQRLELVFPHWEYLVASWSQYDRLDRVSILEPGAERPVRVISVPKTLKTPRIIAIEPTCMQFMQQGLLAAIRESCRADDIARWIVGGTSQVPNQHLAREGSRNGTLATLDLREASDRVSNQHVRILLRNHPHLQAAVDSCRSRKADVPGHGVNRLAKFASMGSALTFPLEEMVFLTIIFLGIEDTLNRPLTRKDIKSYLGRVRVFGDDIVVPKDLAQDVVRRLEDFGLLVNLSKSFWNGKFRESCGGEYYAGTDVSIVRVREFFPTHKTDAMEIISTASLRNRLYKAGMWKSAAYLDDLIGRLIPFPRVSEESPVIGRHSFLGPDMDSGRICPDTHRPLVRGNVIQAVIPSSELDDYGALIKCLTMLDKSRDSSSIAITDLPFGDVEHLMRSGRSRTVSTKTRWAPST